MTAFGFESTALEVVDGIDLTGKRAIVTGGSSGIGVETARALAGAGAEVTLAVRNVEAGERVATEVGASNVAYLELANLESVEAFAAAWDGPLHILVNNAGVMAIPELQLNADGLELQFATNHVGHFALATALHGALAAEGARIVSVSSSGHLRSPVIFDDLNFAFRDYEGVPRLRAVEDGQRPVRGRRDRALGARRDHVQRADAGRDRDEPAAPPGPELHRERPARPASGSRRPSRARRPRSCSRPPRSSRASAAATTRTAPRRPSSSAAARSAPAASRPTRSTPTTPSGSGRSPSACSART